MPLARLALTVPEAAFVTQSSVRGVNSEIDAGIVSGHGKPVREIGSADLLYLATVRDLRVDLTPALRQRLRNAIAAAHDARRNTAQVSHLSVALDAVEAELADRLQILDRLRNEAIEQNAEIMGGEPVLRGTRIPARHVADMVRHGASPESLAEEFDLTSDQVSAAILFDRVSPRQGRPPRKARSVVPPS
ncbi:hypothetical protein JHFBIEKO_2033 [Methylobacterium mesophilicum]|uniref:DUF433 domain-containing protein n=1 Tax=Methylobacterium TaxID=407 RepID=UPI00165051AE|nr:MULTISPECIES: DUF433 domain-containing protein [Methylobacterium]GJE21589.1 hypothetical protein JHFBIEKO_2033 [Methylobacterium mesophilicum]